MVGLLLAVVEGVAVAVPVPVPVGLPVPVAVGVGCGVPLLEKEAEPVEEALAPRVKDDVGEAESVELPERVLLGVAALVPLPDGVGLPVLVALGVGGGVVELE
jgi:hypothetical protein